MSEAIIVAIITATASIMFLSVLSTILYLIGGRIGGADILPVILPALLGGALGSLMLGKLRHEMIEFLLGGMLLFIMSYKKQTDYIRERIQEYIVAEGDKE